MVDERLTDGVRIGQLLSSEVSGNEGRLRDLVLADADPDVEPTVDGGLAYRIVFAAAADSAATGEREIAEVYVQPDRVRIEFVGGDDGSTIPTIAADAADEAGLRVRPKAVRPPRTLVFVEDGAQVKRALPVLAAVADSVGA